MNLPVLKERDVHVWQICLEDENIDGLRTLLSHDELERADRFHFKTDKHRFIAARSAIRRILSKYVNLEPARLAFSYGQNGKPELLPEINSARVRFNVSHSHTRVLLAIAHKISLGVDLEFIDQRVAIDAIAGQFFSQDEIRDLEAILGQKRMEAFFTYWTRKEAYVKALGEGLSVPLNTFSVGRTLTVATVRTEAFCARTSWKVYDIATSREYKAALVAEGTEHRLKLLCCGC